MHDQLADLDVAAEHQGEPLPDTRRQERLFTLIYGTNQQLGPGDERRDGAHRRQARAGR
jgi:hypothetical protein